MSLGYWCSFCFKVLMITPCWSLSWKTWRPLAFTRPNLRAPYSEEPHQHHANHGQSCSMNQLCGWPFIVPPPLLMLYHFPNDPVPLCCHILPRHALVKYPAPLTSSNDVILWMNVLSRWIVFSRGRVLEGGRWKKSRSPLAMWLMIVSSHAQCLGSHLCACGQH